MLHNSQNEQIWILGGIETKTRKVRLSLTKVRNVNAISNFVYDNFYEGTHFVHDSWGGYNFLNNNINFTHEVQVHSDGNFGKGYYSTSHIENYWSQFKRLITRIYGIIPKKNYTLFLKKLNFVLI